MRRRLPRAGWWRTHRLTLLIGAILVVGLVTVTYPSAAKWQAQLVQSQADATLAVQVAHTSPNVRDLLRAEADRYNQALYTGVGAGDLPAEYASTLLLPGSDIMARLRIPTIDVDQPVRHGLGEDALTTGLGHADISSLPVGGPNTNTVIGGHRGLATTEGFTRLPELGVGDLVYVDVLDEVHTYRVTRTEVLSPLEASTFPIEPGKDLLSLLTCTPLGVNTDRWVVTAERVETPPEQVAGAPSNLPRFPWWAVTSGAGVVAIAGYVGAAWRADRRRGVPVARRGRYRAGVTAHAA